MTPQASDVPSLDGPDHRGDDLCRFPWDAQIAGQAVRAGIPTALGIINRDATEALDALLARLTLLEDVARAAKAVDDLRFSKRPVHGLNEAVALRLALEDLARLDAEGSR